MNMNTLETQEVTGELVEVPEDNYFDESQNSEEYCEEMRSKIDHSYDELKDIPIDKVSKLTMHQYENWLQHVGLDIMSDEFQKISK